ncbi:MAG TPA: pseudouridine synthase [Kofleriaceae bacterium]|nr:pseudouridine synthase [Kofleriaceae bacterium]
MSKHPAIRISRRDILFENADYLAVDKRSGWAVHPTVDRSRPNLVDALTSFLKHRDSAPPPILALHHRLDVWTSGVVLFARSERANPVLTALFRDRQVAKTYQAICVGTPPAQEGELVDFLQKRVVDRVERMVKVNSGGQKAITRYQVLSQEDDRFHVSFQPVTGRMHQLRVQSALAGFPILGDPLYGDAAQNRRHGLSAQLLHASRLAFRDPLADVDIDIRSPTPPAFLELGRPRAETRPRYVLFHKPYGVLSQFTATGDDEVTLAAYGLPEGLYPVGRLDKDSEGLLLLTNDGGGAHRLAHPTHRTGKTYWVQVENIPTQAALDQLARGVTLRDGPTRPCLARLLPEPVAVPPRTPPIRVRQAIPTAWLEITITEGKNRQVRRMTAAIGHPTLRLLRVRIDTFTLDGLAPGTWVDVTDRAGD